MEIKIERKEVIQKRKIQKREGIMKMEERRRINMGRGKSIERKGIMKGKNDLKTKQLETKRKKFPFKIQKQ